MRNIMRAAKYNVSKSVLWEKAMNTYFLKDIKVGEHAQILELKESELKQRFLDLGLVPGTYVKCVGISPGRDMKAYLIRGAVILLDHLQEPGSEE